MLTHSNVHLLTRLLPHLLILLCGPLFLFAAQPQAEYRAPLDSTRLTVRQIPASALDRYLEDQAFQYDREPPPISLWDRFKAWLWEMIRDLFVRYGDSGIWEYVIYGAAVVFAAWLVYQVFQSNFSGVLYGRTRRDQAEARILNQVEDIHEIDYGRQIQEAISAHQYRLAIRLYYLQALKILSDRKQIDWKMDKTNHDYLREMTDSPLGQPFAEMTRNFEYAWYGDRPLDEGAFRDVQDTFQKFQRRIAEGTL